LAKIVLGIKYMSHDTAAAVGVDGEILAACEQERYTLDKHSKKFPVDAINDCFRLAGVSLSDVSLIAVGGDPMETIRRTWLRPAMEDPRRIGMMVAEFEKLERCYRLEETIRKTLGWKGDVKFYPHHVAHIASAYFPSGFESALAVSMDGVGDNKSSLIGVYNQDGLRIIHEGNDYPDSLGLCYSAITRYLGWRNVEHEGVIMGLAAFGDPFAKIPGRDITYYDVFSDIIEADGYNYRINKDWLVYYFVRDTWVSERLIEMLGPRRAREDPVEQRHMDVAAALQRRLEDVVLRMLKRAIDETGEKKLVLAGGVGLNCSMNGRIEASGLFDEVFVPAGAGDQGLAIGAAYLGMKDIGLEIPLKRRHDYYLGAFSSDAEVSSALTEAGLPFRKSDDVCRDVAKALHEGKVVGWYQGRAEFGPRALGNRSILAKPSPGAMRDKINAEVKYREWFRPLAPAVKKERVADYFTIGQDSPHMLYAATVRPEAEKAVEATVHVDKSSRVQTVDKEMNERFWRLLDEFEALGGVPVVLNTSFNIRGEPIMNTPAQAIRCFNGTKIDLLAINDFIVEKENLPKGQVP